MIYHLKDNFLIIWNLLILNQNRTTDSLQWFGFYWKLVDIYLESVFFHWLELRVKGIERNKMKTVI